MFIRFSRTPVWQTDRDRQIGHSIYRASIASCGKDRYTKTNIENTKNETLFSTDMVVAFILFIFMLVYCCIFIAAVSRWIKIYLFIKQCVGWRVQQGTPNVSTQWTMVERETSKSPPLSAGVWRTLCHPSVNTKRGAHWTVKCAASRRKAPQGAARLRCSLRVCCRRWTQSWKTEDAPDIASATPADDGAKHL